MTSALLESPPSLFAEAAQAGRTGRGGTTLEECLEQALHTVHADGVAECPVCRAAMRRESHAGHCTGCGSTLS